MKVKLKKITSIFKANHNRQIIAKWIKTHLPENYKDLCYLEPYCVGANLLISKEKSYMEILNDSDALALEIFRCLRDEPKEFLKRLERFSFCEETFIKMKNKTSAKDYLERAVSEYVLRKMSQLELKKNFCKKSSIEWEKSLLNLNCLSNRLQEVFFFNNKAIDIIKVFDSDKTLLYCDPPHLYENKNSKTVYFSDMDTNDHIQLSHALNSFKGKVIISGVTSPLYNRLYKNWSMHRCKIKKKGKKSEVIWKNFSST